MKNIVLFLAISLVASLSFNRVWAETPHPSQYHSDYLNDYMQKFGSWAIEMQILKFKKKKPDWHKIKNDLDYLESQLLNISNAQKDTMFLKLHKDLKNILDDLKAYTQSEKPTIEQLNKKIDDTCLRCHRPEK